jgi:hypothetical protein
MILHQDSQIMKLDGFIHLTEEQTTLKNHQRKKRRKKKELNPLF